MAYSKKERAEYNVHRERVGKELGISKNEYNRLRRTAQALHRHDEDTAMGTKEWRHDNGRSAGRPGTKEYTEKEYTKDVGKAFSKTKALKGKVNLYHQRDPRGAALYAAKHRIHPDKYSSEHVIY